MASTSMSRGWMIPSDRRSESGDRFTGIGSILGIVCVFFELGKIFQDRIEVTIHGAVAEPCGQSEARCRIALLGALVEFPRPFDAQVTRDAFHVAGERPCPGALEAGSREFHLCICESILDHLNIRLILRTNRVVIG